MACLNLCIKKFTISITTTKDQFPILLIVISSFAVPSMLGMAIRDTCHYLEKKQRDVKENASSFVYLVSQFYTSSWSPLASNLEELPSSGSDTEKQLKSYIIFLQQLNLYLK